MKKTGLALGLLATLSLTNVCLAQRNNSGATNSAGKVSMDELARKNKEGAAAVAAVAASNAALSQADQKLMMDVAMGGMMQLEVSKVAVQKASSAEVRQLAQAEVEEQTGLSNKLKEIAAAKGVTLPASPDARTKAMMAKMQGMSGSGFDRAYLQESGVNGHEKLDKVMSTVETTASDASLKSLAAAAHPLVKTHLEAARQMLNMTGSTGGR